MAIDTKVFQSTNPATGDIIWQGPQADFAAVDLAISHARSSLTSWSRKPVSERIEIVEQFAKQLTAHHDLLAHTISLETGKPKWESKLEVNAMIGKIGLSIQAIQQKYRQKNIELNSSTAKTQFRPIGVLGILGPFNFPGHIPNGHIIPALLAGNTIVFKPSEFTPMVAEKTMDIWRKTAIPKGVIQLVQGNKEVGIALAKHQSIDGILFTGSYRAGCALSQILASSPHKILVLEMGGNNPLIIDAIDDIQAAAYMAIQSAYLTAGQRCTCARRLIFTRAAPTNAVLTSMANLIDKMEVGRFDQTPEPFIGPVIHEQAAENLLAKQAELIKQSAQVICKLVPLNNRINMLRPGLIDVTNLGRIVDAECFGPLLQVYRVNDFAQAITLANATRYGLSAAVFCNDRKKFEDAALKIRSGLINWNRPTTGASGKLPFNGIGQSGNHRPAGFDSIDYCCDPVSIVTANHLTMPTQISPGLNIEDVTT